MPPSCLRWLESSPSANPHPSHLKRLKPGRGIDEFGDDLPGLGRRHFLDVHAAGRGGHDRDLAPAPVDEQAQIELPCDVGGGFDQDGGDRLPLCRRLSGHEPSSEHRLAQRGNLVEGAGPLDATGFSAPAGVDLRLDHPGVSPQRLGGRARLRRTGRGSARGHRNTVSAEEILCLEFVEVHRACASCGGVAAARTRKTSSALPAVPHRQPDIDTQSGTPTTGSKRGPRGSSRAHGPHRFPADKIRRTRMARMPVERGCAPCAGTTRRRESDDGLRRRVSAG